MNKLTRSRVGGSRCNPVYAVTAKTFELPAMDVDDRSDETSVILLVERFRFGFRLIESNHLLDDITLHTTKYRLT